MHCNSTIIQQHIARMDEGTLASCNFTAFDEKVARHPAEIAQLLLKSFQKVTAAKMAREHLSQELHLLERVYYSAVDSGRASVRQAMVPSLTSLLTTAHLLDRYILLLTRDCLRFGVVSSGSRSCALLAILALVRDRAPAEDPQRA